MICCLPSSPCSAKYCVTRIDWMISLSLRSNVRSPSCSRSGSSRRARTSCWVIVEAPRLLPRNESRPAATIAQRVEAGVLPEGLVLDRGRGVEHERWDVLEGHDIALELAEAGDLDLTGAVEEHGLLGQGVVGQLLGRFEVAREGAIDRQRGDRGQDPDGGQEREHDDRDPAGGGPAGRLLVVDRVGLGAIGVGHRAQACRIGSDHAAHEDRRGVARA